jgi:hypothetical protein
VAIAIEFNGKLITHSVDYDHGEFDTKRVGFPKIKDKENQKNSESQIYKCLPEGGYVMQLTNTSNTESVSVAISHFRRRTRVIQIVTGFSALLLGTLVYLLDRNPGSVYFIPSWLSLSINAKSIFGGIGNYIPTFVHPFAFVLLTTAFVEAKKQNILLICLTWLAIDGLFEFAQIKDVAQWLVTFVPAFNNIPILENTRNYFAHGTFDILDIASIVLGILTAYFFVYRQELRQKNLPSTDEQATSIGFTERSGED